MLHDTVEDTQTTFTEISERFNERVAEMVREVTDDKTLSKVERKKAQISHASTMSHGAKNVKLADKLANLEDMVRDPPTSWSPAIQRGYVMWCCHVYEALQDTNDYLERALHDVFVSYGLYQEKDTAMPTLEDYYALLEQKK